MPDEQTPANDSNTTQAQQPTYTPPASQADLDRIIADRVSRERAKFADYADLKTKATEFDKLAESQKTELQKAQDRAAAAEKKAADYELVQQRAGWAADIVKDSPVPASALRGNTQDELKAHFEQLKALIPTEAPKKGAAGPYVPGEGSTPAANTLGGARQEFADFLGAQLKR